MSHFHNFLKNSNYLSVFSISNECFVFTKFNLCPIFPILWFLLQRPSALIIPKVSRLSILQIYIWNDLSVEPHAFCREDESVLFRTSQLHQCVTLSKWRVYMSSVTAPVQDWGLPQCNQAHGESKHASQQDQSSLLALLLTTYLIYQVTHFIL